MKMNGSSLAMLALAFAFSVGASAQVSDTVKESGKAVGESTKEGADNVKAAMSAEPHKSEDKAKAQVHKTKAHYHRHKAKKAADAIGH